MSSLFGVVASCRGGGGGGGFKIFSTSRKRVQYSSENTYLSTIITKNKIIT